MNEHSSIFLCLIMYTIIFSCYCSSTSIDCCSIWAETRIYSWVYHRYSILPHFRVDKVWNHQHASCTKEKIFFFIVMWIETMDRMIPSLSFFPCNVFLHFICVDGEKQFELQARSEIYQKTLMYHSRNSPVWMQPRIKKRHKVLNFRNSTAKRQRAYVPLARQLAILHSKLPLYLKVV